MSSQLDVMGRFETFINEFTDEDGILRYREKIRKMAPSGTRSLYISYNDLLHQDSRLAEEVLAYPEECLLEGRKVLINILQQIAPEYLEKHYQFHLRIEDLTDRVDLRNLKTEHLGLLTSFEGVIVGVTDAKPLLIEGHFRCASCGESNQIAEFPEGLYNPPFQCNNDTCQRKGSLVLQTESSRFIDWQKITIQEKPEELPPGQLPQSVMIHVLDDLVNRARPGDRVQVVGILKARASRMLKRGQLATYSKFFNGVSVRKEEAEYIDVELSEEDHAKIQELSKSPYIIEKIRDSLSPSIFGHQLVKEGIACLLFGGTFKETPDGMKIRGESNILLIGDPGVGKSQLLKFIKELAPRALYTTGKGSTAAGLCVSGDSKVWVSNNCTPISDIVEKEFQKGDIEIYNDTMKFKRIFSSNLQTYHSKNLKINLQPIERVWKINSPNNMYSVSTSTGRKLKLTSETCLLTLCPEIGLLWKAAKLLKKKDRVATARKISYQEIKETSSTFEQLIDSPKEILNFDNISNIEETLEESVFESDVFWDEITKIECIEAEDEYVYDLTIPNTHNFIVNGFVTHNTAAVIRDPDTGEVTLEAGALVLADQGIALIDEFDKMRSDDRTAIHEAMEQHTISIAKAGIVATLNARTSILAAANPKRGRWNPFRATSTNLNLPSTILSRFDLMFVLEDKPDLKEDTDKATHILRLHKSKDLATDPPIQKELLRKYIAYARNEIKPKLTDEAVGRLLEYYIELRRTSGKIEKDEPEPIAITPRQLEALVRLSEAKAKMRLSKEVSYEDASGAVHLLNATLEKLARDDKGNIDIDKYSSGMSSQGRRRLDRIDDFIDDILAGSIDGEPVSISAILKQAKDDGLDSNQVEKTIEQRIRVGKLFSPRTGEVKKI